MRGIVEDEHSASSTHIKYRISEMGFIERCSRRFGIRVDNYACFGGTITQGIGLAERHWQSVESSKYCLVEYGGNDCSFKWEDIAADPESAHRPRTLLEDFKDKYTRLVRMLKTSGTIPVLLSLPAIDCQRYFRHVSKGLDGGNILKWLGGDVTYIHRWHEMYNMSVYDIAVQQQVPAIDITSPFLKLRNYSDYLCSDGMHPNEEGHRLIAEAVSEYACNKLNIN